MVPCDSKNVSLKKATSNKSKKAANLPNIDMHSSTISANLNALPTQNAQDVTIIEKLPLFLLRTTIIVRLVQIYSSEYQPRMTKMSRFEKVLCAKDLWQKIADVTNSQVPILRPLNAVQAKTIYAIYQRAKCKSLNGQALLKHERLTPKESSKYQATTNSPHFPSNVPRFLP
jgi:hypothetical protein